MASSSQEVQPLPQVNPKSALDNLEQLRLSYVHARAAALQKK